VILAISLLYITLIMWGCGPSTPNLFRALSMKGYYNVGYMFVIYDLYYLEVWSSVANIFRTEFLLNAFSAATGMIM
jgi:hypothetical protein